VAVHNNGLLVGNPSLVGKVRFARHSRVIQSRILQFGKPTFQMSTDGDTGPYQ
jgi:hypothetical protein